MKNNIITIILVALIGTAAFWYLKKTDDSVSYLAKDAKTADSTDAKYIYSILQKVRQVNLDDSIFQNKVFQNLKDNTAKFPVQDSGRSNPFAPVGADLNVAGQVE